MARVRTSLPSLHLIICRQGEQGWSADLGGALRNALRGSAGKEDAYLATMSDLPIPLRDFSSCPGAEVGPAALLDRSLHSLVVVLVDDELDSDKEWQAWLEACEAHVADSGGRHRIVAFCLSESLKTNYKPIDHRPIARSTVKIGYNDRQTDGELAFGEYAERPAWFALYIFQTCRQLLAQAVFEPKEEDKRKLRLFISHAKKDSLPLANSVRSALDRKAYFKTWYDAKDLDGVDDWREAIREGVTSSVVIVLRTEKYDTRPWCRQEFLWAEQCSVPIVCVEARNSLEFKADALATNRVPTVRIPDGNLFRILFLALKESLRIMRLERLRQEWIRQHAGMKNARVMTLIPYSPDLQQLALASQVIKDLNKSSRRKQTGYSLILYADPPLRPELYQASKSFVKGESGCMTYMLTPALLPFWEAQDQANPDKMSTYSLWKSEKEISKSADPSVSKHRVNISISEHPPDLKRLGFSSFDVNNFTIQFAQVIIANEGIVALGHDWREDGVMQKIYQFAEEHQSVILDEGERKGLVENYLFWGAAPGLNERKRGHLRGVLDFIFCDQPDDPKISRYKSLATVPKSQFGYAFARSLTVMRRRMTSAVLARICLGGRDMDPRYPEKGPKGRCPGVVEEAYLSCVAGQPLYLSGVLGGVTGQVINAFLKKDAKLEFRLPEDVRKHYPDSKERPGRPDYDGPLSSETLLNYFSKFGIEKLSRYNRLTPEENIRLFEAGTLDEARDIILRGLSRLVGATAVTDQ